ncbi:hypothetical protein A9Q98_13255 [Thalassotalea sp. 42_200_T64]|nr:hypothetical protein A9Q98_13255 [Thalassotalea sp. 42_200_T64]
MDIDKSIQITPKSKRNGLFLIVLGVILLLSSFALNNLFWDQFKLQLMLLMFSCFIILLLGFGKYSEPNISYNIGKDTITFHHRFGSWQINWQDIISLGEVKANNGLTVFGLPYIGIKLNKLDNIASHISPRLANKLLHEQQELIRLAVEYEEISSAQAIINFSPYPLADKIIKGPVAAWLHRTEVLAIAYGYHLFLAEDSFDQELMNFLSLLKNCQHYVKQNTG